VARSRHCNARIRVPCNHLAPSLREGLAEGQTGEVRAMNTTDKPDGVNPKDLPNRPTLTEGQMIPEGNQSKKRIVEVYVRPSREHPDGIYALRMDYRLAVATGRAGLHAVRVKEQVRHHHPATVSRHAPGTGGGSGCSPAGGPEGPGTGRSLYVPSGDN